MHQISFFLGFILLLIIIDHDYALKHHGNNHESLLDKQERERNEKDRKKKETKEENHNLTCYKCNGDFCRDPFQINDSIFLIQCEHSCWKGVFTANIHRSCGNKRCEFTFQGNSILSNTCCQTSFCNDAQINHSFFLLIILTFLSIIIIRMFFI